MALNLQDVLKEFINCSDMHITVIVQSETRFAVDLTDSLFSQQNYWYFFPLGGALV
jgi:hypothetical protein